MTRLYIKLYLILIVALALFIIGLQTLPKVVLDDSLRSYYQRVMNGAYSLVMEKLPQTQQAEWDQRLEAVSKRFVHPLTLQRLDELELAESKKQQLRNGEMVFREVGDQVRFFWRMYDSDRYLVMHLGDDPEHEAINESVGIVSLIEERFINSPEHDWPAVQASLQEDFELPLHRMRIDDAALPQAHRDAILRGNLVVTHAQTDDDVYYKRLGDSDWVFRGGPLYIPPLLRHFEIVILLVLAVMVGVASYLWMRPVWRDLGALDRGVRLLADGQLDARVAMPRRMALRPMAETFNHMAERIQRLVQSHRQLTGAVSHELRTPIARLRFRSELLQGEVSDADRQRHINAMQNDLQELEELVSESLAYARLDREGPELNLHQVSFGRWVQAQVDDMAFELPGRQLHIEIAEVDQDTPVAMDERLLRRALRNLLHNAHRHAESAVRVACSCQQGMAVIQVEDDGHGIAEDDRERIFEPFARLDAARARETGGVGLGLSIVKEVMRWHMGEVRIQASPLGGACFRLSWPLAKKT